MARHQGPGEAELGGRGGKTAPTRHAHESLHRPKAIHRPSIVQAAATNAALSDTPAQSPVKRWQACLAWFNGRLRGRLLLFCCCGKPPVMDLSGLGVVVCAATERT